MFFKITKSAAFILAIQLAVVAPLMAQRSSLAPQRSDLIPGVTSGANVFTPQQDIEMGRILSQDAAASFIFSEDATTRGYIRTLGSELAARAPGYRYPWQFNVFIDPEIRSIALPGGYIYVSSGLVTAMQSEPQLASVLAHQIAHVAARHGTQQVSTRYSQLTNTRLGRVTVNDAIARLNLTIDPDSPVSAFTTQAEQQADTIATQILYDSRFDPRIIPTAFQRLINQRDLSRDFAANHPTPANRTAAIRRELQRRGPLLASWRGTSTGFQTAQQVLRNESSIGLAGRVDDNNPYAPSTRLTTYRGRDFDIQYPDNWRVDDTSISVMLAPEGGIVRGELAFGMLMDTFQPRSQNIFGLGGRNSFSLPGGGQDIVANTTIAAATDELISELRRSNPNMRVIRRTPKRVDGFEALTVELNNDSPLGGTEVNSLTAVLHSNGLLYYFMGVAPQSNYNQYSPAFDRMINSIRFY
jgi:predicted Zn-dependent protease